MTKTWVEQFSHEIWQRTNRALLAALHTTRRTTNTSRTTRLLFIQEATQEPKLSELCSGCTCASKEACPHSAHFAPVIAAASLTELGKGLLAARSYSLQLHTGNYYSLTKHMLWCGRLCMNTTGGPLPCISRSCTSHTRPKGTDTQQAAGKRDSAFPNARQSVGGTAAKFAQSKEICCIF